MSLVFDTEIAYNNFNKENNLNSLYKNTNKLIEVIEKDEMTKENIKKYISRMYIDLICIFVDKSFHWKKIANYNKNWNDETIRKNLIQKFCIKSDTQRVSYLHNVSNTYKKKYKGERNFVSYYEKIPNGIIVNELRKNLLLIDLSYYERIIDNFLWVIHLICYKVYEDFNIILAEYLSTKVRDLVIKNSFGNNEVYDLTQDFIKKVLYNNEVKKVSAFYKNGNIINSLPIEDLKNRLSIHRKYSEFNTDNIDKFIIETENDTIYIKLESNKTLIERRKGLN